MWERTAPFFALVGVLVFTGSFSLGMGGIPWVIMSEVTRFLKISLFHSTKILIFDYCLFNRIVSDIPDKHERHCGWVSDPSELVRLFDHLVLLRFHDGLEFFRDFLHILEHLRIHRVVRGKARTRDEGKNPRRNSSNHEP